MNMLLQRINIDMTIKQPFESWWLAYLPLPAAVEWIRLNIEWVKLVMIKNHQYGTWEIELVGETEHPGEYAVYVGNTYAEAWEALIEGER
jgi:hypothetical protein